VFERFHAEAALPLAPAGTEEQAAPGDGPDEAGLYAEVPSLVTAAQVREAMAEIGADLRAQGDLLLIEGPDGYRMATDPRFGRWVRLLRQEPRPARLSASALETLAIVAYRQPVTRLEIESIRGVSAEAGIARLLERGLVAVTGRADLPGRPLQYSTTEAFLDFVGVRSLADLPASDVLTTRQIDEWLRSAATPNKPGDAEMGLEDDQLPLQGRGAP
jgi:segregation and condensation protein B